MSTNRSRTIFMLVGAVLAIALAAASAILMIRLAGQSGYANQAAHENSTGSVPVAPAVDAGPEVPGTPGDDESALPTVSSDWLADTSKKTGVPARVLQAYAAAALWAGENRESCRISWNTIAGIGAVESNHGHYNGSSIEPDGQLKGEIIGAQLNGMRVAEIRDTDDGDLDGDTEFDRAVGPLQFIPSTWSSVGTDGNGDGKRDPNNIDDAAITAAEYLCAGNRNLATAQGWEAAIMSYNPSLDYVAKVLTSANNIGRLADPAADAPAPVTVPASPGATPPVQSDPRNPPAAPDPSPTVESELGGN